MAEIIWNPSNIEVPQNSAVLLCGAQNSGKSTFANSHFEKSMILSSDNFFLEVAKKNANNPLATATSVLEEAEGILVKRISEMSGKIIVIDDVSPEFDFRVGTIDFVRDYFDNIIIVSFSIEIKELLSRKVKPNNPSKMKFGFVSPTKEQILLTALTVNEQIQSGKISSRTHQSYVFTSSKSADNCNVHF